VQNQISMYTRNFLRRKLEVVCQKNAAFSPSRLTTFQTLAAAVWLMHWWLWAQEGAFLVRVGGRGDESYPYTLCVAHKGESYNIQIRKRSDGKFALGTRKEKETVSDHAAVS